MAFWAEKLKFLFPSKKITAILTYHAISRTDTNPLIADRIHNIPPDMLYAQLQLLKKHFTVLPLEELAEHIEKGRSTRGMAAVTFDDGYASVMENAAPVLESLGIPATFFLTTDLIKGGVFWRDKVRYIINQHAVEDFLFFVKNTAPGFPVIEPSLFYSATKNPARVNSRVVDGLIDSFLAAQGIHLSNLSQDVYCSPADFAKKRVAKMTFSNHSHSHYVLSSMTREEQYEDIARSEKILQDLKLPTCKVFSIPFGTPADFNEETLRILKEFGYRCYVLSSGEGVRDALDLPDLSGVPGALLPLIRFMPRCSKRFLYSRR